MLVFGSQGSNPLGIISRPIGQSGLRCVCLMGDALLGSRCSTPEGINSRPRGSIGRLKGVRSGAQIRPFSQQIFSWDKFL